MRVIVTGSDGFLGWHTRVRLRALTEHEVVSVSRTNWADLDALIRTADVVIHIAGVNRGADSEVLSGNQALAQDLATAIRSAGRPVRVVYANSIQAGNDTPYGAGKAAAAELLRQAAGESGAVFVDVRLPNIFGEHGRPNYNSFVATFVEAAVQRQMPSINDRLVPLLHAQDAAQALLDALTGDSRELAPRGSEQSVLSVWRTLETFVQTYHAADVPKLASAFDVDLFNTLRARLFPAHYPFRLVQHTDPRGRLVEAVRARGNAGQTFVSTTKPGITRGDHFHLRKIERFAVVSGSARISLRRVFGDEVISFDVDGAEPAVVDMPTMWVHNITNTGDSELTTLFWTDTLFDAEAPDTYWEKVELEMAL